MSHSELAVTVDGKPAIVRQGQTDTAREQRLLATLELAQKTVIGLLDYRDLLRLTKDVQVMQRLAKEYDMASSIQRIAAETAIHCLHALGVSLRGAFDGLSSARIAMQTAIASSTVNAALVISRFPALEVRRIVRQIIERGDMPTVGVVSSVLRSKSPNYRAWLSHREELAVARSDGDATRASIQLTDELIDAWNKFDVLRRYIGQLNSAIESVSAEADSPDSRLERYRAYANPPSRKEYAQALWAFRKNRRLFARLSREMQSARQFVREETGFYESK